MTKMQLNLSLLQAGGFLRLDDSRRSLFSQAGKTQHKWVQPPGMSSQSGLAQQIEIGSIRLSYGRTWARLLSPKQGSWGINTARFAGTPKLQVGNAHGSVTLTLSGARFPGLDISADLSAKFFVENGVAMMDLRFAFCGFATRVKLADWLEHASPAAAPVLFDDTLCRIADGLNLRIGGTAGALFHPSWLFVFDCGAKPGIELTTAGRTIDTTTLALALLAPGMPSTLSAPANRRVALFIPEQTAFDLPLWPERSTGWRFAQARPAFRWLAVEADEQLDGSIRRAVLAGGSSADSLDFRPGADLLDDCLSVPLQKPLYAAVYRGNGSRIGSALLAQRRPQPLALHTRGCSLALGPMPRQPGFLLLDIPAHDGQPPLLYLGPPVIAGGVPRQGLYFTLAASAPRLGEIVVDPLPPLVGNLMVLTIAPLGRPLLATEGEIAVGDAAPEARIRLPEWTLTQIVRPRDLMVLGLQFVGLRPEFRGAGPGRLFRSGKDVPRVIVYFPPQSLGEQTFVEDTTTTADSVPAGLVNYRCAGLSRLVFDLKDGLSEIPYAAASLLDWDGGSLTPRLDERARSPTPQRSAFVAKPGLVRARLASGWLEPAAASQPEYPPALDSTAIEAPYRLLLSPDQHATWDSALSPAMTAGPRSVLWHARLKSAKPLVRALWAVDKTPGVAPDPFGENIALTASNRQRLVDNSPLKAVDSKRLMLTALGAWLDLDGDWSSFPDNQVTLEKWLHRSTLGRDQYVKVVTRGYLFPFGHKAVRIDVSERKFGQNPPGRVGAWLRKKTFLVVREFERNYAADHAAHAVFPTLIPELPFTRVRLLTQATPPLDQPFEDIVGSGGSVFWPRVGHADYLFSLSATDRDGREIEFSAPLAFVTNDVALDQATVDAVIAHQANPSHPEGRRSYDFAGQKIVFADTADTTDQALETGDITFSALFRQKQDSEAWARPFYPLMRTAAVVVPAMRQFGGIDSANDIAYFADYLSHGFAGPNARGQVFARFVPGVPIEYGGGNGTDKVGGMISPGMLAGGLSRLHGIVGTAAGSTTPIDAQLANFAGGAFNPSDFFGGTSAKILGGIDLFSILGDIGNFTAGGGTPEIPRWINAVENGKLTRSFSWNTKRLQASAGPFVSGSGRALNITCTVQVGAEPNQNRARLSAQLLDFTIKLAEVIEIPFDDFSLTVEAGRKPEVNVGIGKVKFCGALGFVATIQDELHLDRFVDPPTIDVSAEGLSIGYGIQIPSIQVGVFALRNLALSAAATLPFTGDPFRARFALSERHDPFLITVSLFTGGGFFAVGVGLDGVESLEVALEFGGSIALDIGVASGGVYVMAGIYIKVSDDASELTGYVRAGGALSVLGLITVSVEFYLGLTYENKDNRKKAWGEASMTVEVAVLFFHADVTLTVRREFAGDGSDPTLADTHSQDDWDNDYIAAFAD